MSMLFNSEFYGDNARWFIGTVEQFGGDEPTLGRVRVRIQGIHSPEISLHELPYAQVVIPTTEGGVSGIGRSCGLIEGATVFGIFMDGKNSQLPLVIGSIPQIETPSRGQGLMNRSGEAYLAPGDYSTANSVLLGDNKKWMASNDVKENTRQAWDFLIQKGYGVVQVAGILGNLLHESGNTMSPYANNPNDRGAPSVGLAQWRWYKENGGRQADLFAYADKHNDGNWQDLYLQLNFLDYELTKHIYLGGAELRKATTVVQTTLVFMRKFERPQELPTKSVDGANKRAGEDERLSNAAKIFNNYAANMGSS